MLGKASCARSCLTIQRGMDALTPFAIPRTLSRLNLLQQFPSSPDRSGTDAIDCE